MKIGRNAPCPCGSGKKYKKCCLNKNKSVTPPESLHYRRLSKSLDKLMPELIDHAHSVFGEAAYGIAMAEFFGWPDPDEFPDEETFERVEMLFWPWFVFNWEFDSLDFEENSLDVPEEATVAELYSESQDIDPQSLPGKLIDAANRTPYSFLEILTVQPGESVRVKDVLTGDELLIQERLGSEMLSKGGILYGRVVQVDSVGMFLGLSAIVLPPRMKPQLIELRQNLSQDGKKLNRDDLYEWDLDIRELYLEMDRALHTLPEMQNTDGDPLEFHKLSYDIDSADLAVEKLASLSTTETLAEIRKSSQKDKDGNIRRASIHWNRKSNASRKGDSNTVLGHVEINGSQLTVSVNSARRARTIQKLIEERLGSAARLRLDAISDLDASTNEPDENQFTEEELMNSPEIQQQIGQLLEMHWENWVDQKIPALGNKTPRQAVRTTDGREAVEALLLDAEKMARNDPIRSSLEKDLIMDVRRQLKLDRPQKQKSASPDSSQLVKRIAQVKELIADFGHQRLSETYTGYAAELCDAVAADNRLNIHRGRIEIWSAAIVYAIAQLNFLFSNETPFHLTPDELCNWFKVKKTTVSNKAAMIRTTMDLFYDDERFCAPHITSNFQFFEDENGFIIPANRLEPGRKQRFDPIPLKPPPEKKIPEKAVKKKKPVKKNDDRQLSLFDD